MEISLVVGCMNRAEFLIKAISTWLTHPEIKEIIIVDWNSSRSVSQELDFLNDKKRVKIWRICQVPQWILSLALNFGFAQAQYPIILKVDADTIIRPGFFTTCKMDNTESAKIFFAGNWRTASDDNNKHLNGVVMVSRTVLQKIGGYNEHIRTYGWDDTDLYERLEAAGLERRDFPAASLYHLPHPDSIRVAGGADIRFEIVKNMHLCKKLPWYAKVGTQYVELEPRVYQPLSLSEYEPSIVIQNEVRHQAYRTLLNDHGFTWSMTADRPLELLMRLYHHRQKSKLFIEPRNGLGNRLRALASAAVVADATDRLLVIVWKSDVHCQASFGDLFEERHFLILSDWTGRSNQQTATVPSYYDTMPENARKQPIDTTPPNDLYIVSACVLNHSSTNWLKESEWLRHELKLRPVIQQSIDSIADRLGFATRPIIGVHIRMGQPSTDAPYEDTSSYEPSQQVAVARNRALSHYSGFMAEMERLWRLNNKQTFFICADNPHIYEAFEHAYPSRVGETILYLHKAQWDRSRAQLIGALQDIYLLAKCSYLMGSPWSSFTELVSRLSRKPVKLAGEHFAKYYYGLLCYHNSYNLGDDIQSWAARQFLPRVDFLINRDDQSTEAFHPTSGQAIPFKDIDRPILLIENGWFDGRLTKPHIHPKIKPLFISFHLNESPDLFAKQEYQVLRAEAMSDGHLLGSSEARARFGAGTVGTRDIHTMELFAEAHLSSYYSSCLTLTLQMSHIDRIAGVIPTTRISDILIVDAHIGEPELLRRLVPEDIRQQAQRISHGLTKIPSPAVKQKMTLERLYMYSAAKLVITNRLHCALPCLAFKTPVLFLFSNMNKDPRFDATLTALLGNGQTLPADWSWETPTLSAEQLTLVDTLATKLRTQVYSWIDNSEKII